MRHKHSCIVAQLIKRNFQLLKGSHCHCNANERTLDENFRERTTHLLQKLQFQKEWSRALLQQERSNALPLLPSLEGRNLKLMVLHGKQQNAVELLMRRALPRLHQSPLRLAGAAKHEEVDLSS